MKVLIHMSLSSVVDIAELEGGSCKVRVSDVHQHVATLIIDPRSPLAPLDEDSMADYKTIATAYLVAEAAEKAEAALDEIGTAGFGSMATSKPAGN